MIYFSLVEKESANGFVYQEKLKTQHIAIFGVGGWGSWMALNLCSVGIGKLTLVDGDVVEPSNLHRQILFETSDIGISKVLAASSRLKKMNPYIFINPVHKRIGIQEEAIEEIIENCTLIVLAWTNLSYFKTNTAENIIHKIAYKKKIPILEIGADPLFVSIGPLIVNKDSSPCFECIKHKMIKDHYSLNPLVKSFQEIRLKDKRKNLNRILNSYQSAPPLSAMAGLATEQIIKFTTGCEKSVLLGTQFKLNLQSYEMTKEKFKRYKECIQCGKA
jgi:molybdopterin/thiamine biosynthesis adenylyltransferase